MKIEETFVVEAPADRVWAFLTTPERVAEILPGARLEERIDESTYRGGMEVRVGPMSADYSGTVTFEELDAEGRRAVIVASGDGARGMGSAEMRMESSLVEGEDGSTEVCVVSDVKVTGVLAQFGRGMIEEVSGRMFRQFTRDLRDRLEGVEGAERDEGAEVSAAVEAEQAETAEAVQGNEGHEGSDERS